MKSRKPSRDLSPNERLRSAHVEGYYIACSPIYGYYIQRRRDQHTIWSHPGAASLSHKMVDEMAVAIRRDQKREKHRNPEALIRAILAASAHHFGLAFEDLSCDSRKRHLADARHVAFYLTWKHGHNLAAAARAIGRDPSTAVHGRNKIRRLMEYDRKIRERVAAVEAEVGLSG